MPIRSPGVSPLFFGTGVDGDVVFEADGTNETPTISRDMYFKSLTLKTTGSGSVILRPNGWRIYAREYIKIDAGCAIEQNGDSAPQNAGGQPASFGSWLTMLGVGWFGGRGSDNGNIVVLDSNNNPVPGTEGHGAVPPLVNAPGGDWYKSFLGGYGGGGGAAEALPGGAGLDPRTSDLDDIIINNVHNPLVVLSGGLVPVFNDGRVGSLIEGSGAVEVALQEETGDPPPAVTVNFTRPSYVQPRFNWITPWGGMGGSGGACVAGSGGAGGGGGQGGGVIFLSAPKIIVTGNGGAGSAWIGASGGHGAHADAISSAAGGGGGGGGGVVIIACGELVLQNGARIYAQGGNGGNGINGGQGGGPGGEGIVIVFSEFGNRIYGDWFGFPHEGSLEDDPPPAYVIAAGVAGANS